MRRSANAESQFWAVLGTRHARRLCSCIIARASPRADGLTQDAPHFLDRLGMPLCRVAGADDFFRLDALDVGAFVGHHAVGLSGDWSFAEHGDDRMGGDVRIDGSIVHRANERIAGTHVVGVRNESVNNAAASGIKKSSFGRITNRSPILCW